MKTNLKNIILGIKYQLPLKRLLRNFFITRNAWGMFSIYSHIVQETGKEKIGYNTIESAKKAAQKMNEKYGKHFSVYYCIFCGKFHLGKNRDNKK